MTYTQNIDQVNLIIFCLDGGLLDLNRPRFNFLKNISKEKQCYVTKEEFEDHLGDYRHMYDFCDVSKEITNDQIVSLTEKDLYNYFCNKKSLIKEGALELLILLNHKKYKIAVISTHTTTQALNYIKKAEFEPYVDYVIGNDEIEHALPEPDILNQVCNDLEVNKENALVIANFPNLVLAALDNSMNVIYLEDLCKASDGIISRCYMNCKNIYDLSNAIIFSRYEDKTIYGPILGMNEKMSYRVLRSTYHRLMDEYSDDPVIQEAIEDTYHYYLTKIDKDRQYIEIKKPLETNYDEQVNKEELDENKNQNIEKEKEEIKINPEIFEHTVSLDPNEIKELSSLIDEINSNDTDHIQIKENKVEEKKEHTSLFMRFIYTLFISAMISFILFLINYFFKGDHNIYTAMYSSLYNLIGNVIKTYISVSSIYITYAVFFIETLGICILVNILSLLIIKEDD